MSRVYHPLERLGLYSWEWVTCVDTRHDCTLDCTQFPFAQLSSRNPLSSQSRTNKLLASALMSHPQLAASSSSNFQLIISSALKAYEKRTKKDLLAHPLAAQLQSCESLSAILAVLQQQVEGLDQTQCDDRWTKWLDPTVKVLFAFSATVGAGVGLVSPRTRNYLRSAPSHLLGRYSPLPMWSLRVSGFFFQCVSSITRRGSLLH